MVGGYVGKTLLVDLSLGKVVVASSNEEFARTFMGGSGYACRYAFDNLHSRRILTV